MCCIFTCCGWMLDLIQRVWVFFMSCCVFTAICCVLITSSMAGVALGYNYSLAEYIDTKETNVSVYIKRGVFDDDVINDLVNFRRKAPPSFSGADENAKNEQVGPDEIPPSGRRLDDTILQSNDNNFEGSLMKLTLQPPYSSTVLTTVTDDAVMIPVMSSYPPGSLGQLKAIQGIINARKSAAARNPLDKDTRRMYGGDGNVNPYLPDIQTGPDADQFRRMASMLQGPGIQRPNMLPGLPYPTPSPDLPMISISPARFAVPDTMSQGNWDASKMSPENYRRFLRLNSDDPTGELPTVPQPVTYRVGPIRPLTTLRTTEPQKAPQLEQSIQDGNDKQNVIEENLGEKSGSELLRKKEELLQRLPGPKIVGQENNEYYDDELKGLPIRKRSIIHYNELTRYRINDDKINKFQDKVKNEVYQEINPGLINKLGVGNGISRILSKCKVDNSVTEEITDSPSTLGSKLHFLDIPSNETSSANEMEDRNDSKTVGLNVSDSHPIRDSFIGKSLKILKSMFS